MLDRSFLCTLVMIVAITNTLIRVVAGDGAAASTYSIPTSAASSSDAGDKPLFPWWDMLTHGTRGDAWKLCDPRWWFNYIVTEFRAEPAHATVETICILTIIYLIVLRKPAPLGQEKLTKKEEDELIAEWKPVPLCPQWEPSEKTRFIVESATGRTIVANGSTYLNFASNNFLGLADRAEMKAACRATIEKYGVGSCGPRGFYGTFDLHLEIEAALAKFMCAEECILYSDAAGCVSSVIPAFAKKGDIIIVDDSVGFFMQQGCLLSRSTIYYFKHGDMADLEKVIKEVEKKHKPKGAPIHRKFIVVEGVSSVYGDITPLDRVVSLKHEYGYRLIVDDSLGFGALGEHGRGTAEHFHIGMQPNDSKQAPGVDILCATMDGALASVGGFCVGNHQVVDHQRLSGSGYCFSASSPPYTSTAAIETLKEMAAHPQLAANLRKKAMKLRKALASINELVVLGSKSDESPVIHLARKHHSLEKRESERKFFELVNDTLRLSSHIITSVPEFIPADKTKAIPTLRISVSNLHTDNDFDKLVKAITHAVQVAAKKA